LPGSLQKGREEQKMGNISIANGPVTAMPLRPSVRAVLNLLESLPGAAITAWPDYIVDAFQRGVLFVDLLRQRGNRQMQIEASPMATVLRFEHEPIMNGRSLARPMNYTLSRILPPPGATMDARKRPVVVVDPRAGEGPGISGFKAKSEVGDALNAGHAVYFIGFSATPEQGQQFLDVVEGQVAFFERVVELHPDAPRPFAIGNCQAGYQTLMVAMLRPDLFGPCLLAGSPMSFWQGEHGKNPMRYAGGLAGGSWLTALTSDLGNGMFDGTWLVLNFDNLGPANWLWGKQYHVYADVDAGADRYLSFEQWWGDFIQLRGDELQFLVDNLFIGDKLTRNQLHATDGTTFDIRNVTSPIIAFTSTGDNISPPPQALGWIVDLYPDVAAIRATDQTIVYCVTEKIGHLALYVSTKVGAKEDEEFIRLIDVIDYLPPGLFEMVVAPRPPDVPRVGFVTGDWIARFEPRTIDDISALGRNSSEDDRAFAAAAVVSERNLAAYRTWVQPWMRLLANRPAADLAKALNPLSLSYTMFADRNPWMTGIHAMASSVSAARKPVAAGNPFLTLQERVSEQIMTRLNSYRDARDRLQEQVFFGIYGSPVVQALCGIDQHRAVRPVPETSAEKLAAQRARTSSYARNLNMGGFDAAFTRAVLYVLGADRSLDQRCALALNAARDRLMHLTLPAFKLLVREQFFLLHTEGERAIGALLFLVPESAEHAMLLREVDAILGAGSAISAAEQSRRARLSLALTAAADMGIAAAD
jgi:hypothetical protein